MMNARLEELRSKFQENPRRYFAPFANELRKAGDPAQAISVCRAHLVGQPGHVSGHIVLGQALYEAGEANEAREIFTAALELDPENLIALRTLGEIAQVNGEFSTARQWYERLLDADPRNTEVAQLLKDIPDMVPSEPAASAAPESAVEESERTPLTVRNEIEQEPEPAPASKFHTTFSGSGPAYRSKDEEEQDKESVPEAPSAEKVDAGQAAHPAEATPEPQVASPVAAAPAEPAGSLDMVDLDAFPPPTLDAEPPVESHLPDESYAPPEDYVAADLRETEFEPAASQQEALDQEEELEEEFGVSMTAAEDHILGEFAPPPEEPPRALFAEHGFEGPASDDHLDWMKTPSAAFSDLEAAPEDWLDESPAVAGEADDESAESVAESPAEEPAAAEASAPDPATDSWFEHVEGASLIESIEVTTDEFWLPPELPHVGAGDETTAPDAESREAVAETDVAAHEEADSLAMASAAPEMHQVEPEPLRVDVTHDDSVDAVAVEPPAEVSMAPSLQQAEAIQPPEEPRAIDAGQFDAYDVDFAAAETTIVTPANADAVIGRTPAFDEVPTPLPAPFVTETLAELYLQQGFRDEALTIYRQLAERDPSDETLQRRIEAIERSDLVPSAPVAEAPAENRAASQSVRTFFSRLARRPAVSLGSEPGETSPAQDVPFAAAASALANLFAASNPPASDENAAATLAGAFTDPAGRPSRAADRELSLDHLFRDVPPGGSASGGVSLDEFYATPNAPPGSPTEPGEETDSAESGGTDIRQFTAWLEGLRKK